jgi:hypothetical protein
MSCTWFAIFPDTRLTDTPEQCLLSQGFQHDIAAGDRVALTGPIGTMAPAAGRWLPSARPSAAAASSIHEPEEAP